MKKIALRGILGAGFVLTVLFLFNPTPVDTEDITTVGIVNMETIISQSYQDSQQYRKIEKMETDMASALQEIVNEIEELTEEKVEATEQNKSLEVIDIERKIEEKANYYREVKRVYENRIRVAKDSFLSSSFGTELFEAIEVIAESRGFTVILEEKDPHLLWSSASIDITQQVIQRIRSSSR